LTPFAERLTIGPTGRAGMKRIAVLVGLATLAGCGSPGPVGENSPDSIKTTAEGKIVGTIPSPTPTPEPAVDNATIDVNSIDGGAIANDASGAGE